MLSTWLITVYLPPDHLAEVCCSGFSAVWLFLSSHFPYCALCSKTVRRSSHLRSGFMFHKIPRRNTGAKLHNSCFSSRISGHQKHKQQKKKQTYWTSLKWKMCISGHDQESEETTCKIGENIANSVSDKAEYPDYTKNITTKRTLAFTNKCCNEEPYTQGVLHVWADPQNKFSERCMIFWFLPTVAKLPSTEGKLWFWRRLLRVPWTARRSNQSILKEINPEYSLEGLMLKLKLQYFGHLIQRADSLEKTLVLGKTEGRRRKG